MMPKLKVLMRRFMGSLVLVWLIVGCSFASSLYHFKIAVGADGRPTLQLTNDSPLPIFAFVMVEFPSLGMEGRTYYDFYVNERELPIAPGASIVRGLSSFRGSEAKVRAEVRAVVFQDGTSDGDPIWVNAILAQRLRLYDRMRGVHELLEQQVDRGISLDGILQVLRDAQVDAEKEPADDDMRPIDSVVFYGAISTFSNNRQVPAAVVLERYLGYLRPRIAQLERSRPAIEAIRSLPINTPKPLSDTDLPSGLRAARASLESKEELVPGGKLSSCTSGPFDDPNNTPLDDCLDSEGTGYLGYTNTQYNLFTTTWTQYTASTGKTTSVPWSWSPGPNDLKIAYGNCTSFPDCDGANDVFYKRGTATGQGVATLGGLPQTVSQGQNSKSFWWLFDDYSNPTFSGCDSCDIDPDGQYNPQSTNAPRAGITFYFNYACSVTP
jgi:hypothetical protein